MEALVNDNKILETITGSFLYGTNVETSDKDYVGIFIAPTKYYLGLEKVEEVDLSIVSKLENGKNSEDAIDRKYYEFRKYIKLAIENNPNILSMLFASDNCITYSGMFGMGLLDMRKDFLHKGLTERYLGYAFSQKHKMIIKTDNYTGLKKFDEWLDDNLVSPNLGTPKDPSEYYSNQLLAELRTIKSLNGIVKFSSQNAAIGDINISLTDKLSKVRAKIKQRLSKVGNREELYTKYGYDVKFGMNLVRLMLEGHELLETGNLIYPLTDRQTLLDIRNGKWKREEIIQYAEDLEQDIKALREKSPLPSHPQYDKINEYLVKTVKGFWLYKDTYGR